MSKKAAASFIKKASKDDALKEEIREHIENIVAIGAARGMKFTRKELAQVLHERWSDKAEEAGSWCYVCLPGSGTESATTTRTTTRKPTKPTRGKK